MKAKTTEILDHMFAKAEEHMLGEGWKEQEVSSFMNDPVIRLFYGSCAEELGKVQDEIYHVERRLINKTIEHLLPEEFQTPVPAHAIFHAQPLNKLSESLIWPECQFTVANPAKTKELVFAPAGNFPLFQAEIGYLIFRDRFYQYKDGNRVQIMSGDNSNAVQDDILWLGIKDLNKILPKEKLSLFFALPQSVNEQFAFLNALKYSKCYSADGVLLKRSSGLGSDDLDYWDKMLKQPDYMIYRMFQNTRNWYQKHFLTLHNLNATPGSASSFPTEIKNQFPEGELKKIKDDIYWIKFSFNNLLNERWVHLLYCSINCFPALNLKLEQKLFDVEEMPVNIYPVSSDDFILSVRTVSGKVKAKQEELNYSMVDPELRSTVGKEGEAIFRKGSLGRITAEKLKSMLNLLLNIMREEIVLLTKVGTKEDITKLNRLNRAAIDFEKCIEVENEKKGKYAGSVILKAYKDQNKVFIRYWTTAAEEANQVKPLPGEEGQKQCEIGFAPEVSSESVRLITATSGGKKQPTDEEYIDTLRKLLLTRSRIVTAEDVKAFCYEYFHPYIVSVEVQKSVRQSSRPGHGVVRCIDIFIRFIEKKTFADEELTFFKEELLQKLEQHAANVMPFNVEFVKD
jgi:hypothetical protein